ncbi:monovalent cation/H+ antiporter subunit D [Mesorhizobium sp. SP-1A]|uniref:monovalent cation/H+ antiporter subunit D n=1 Tax=Mesorhizobium sp. SP-1A TaxID=3077840 RepID=UPI0028F72CEE|nr:monovalent cation/H+ antiporter subunit D [Mesorhizobium sp. SP-1A]
MDWTQHLLIVPILLPLAAGAVLLLVDERRHWLKASINIGATVLLLVVALALLRLADMQLPDAEALTRSYALGDWPAPFGIVLVLDRLSALLLLLTSILAVASLTFSLARWHRAGPHFHTLFQFLLMGLGGAFLTGDLFNLFVFFEVLLAASYGLLLHGSGVFRVRAGLHYIAVNLAASLLFLIGVSLIYGVTGTLNMADLAVRLPAVAAGDRTLLQAGLAILGVAFLVKAGMWPLCFWLPSAYMAAAAPVAALFAILSKVGFYVLLRLTLLLFGSEAGALTGFGGPFLLFGGMATIAFGAIGVLASQAMGRLAGYSLLVSSGTLLASVGMGDTAVVSGALFYLVSSTLTIAALFLLIELVERAQEPGADLLTVTMEAYGDEIDDEETEDEEVGVALPGALAIIGICFGCIALLLAGLPPLSGFIGKFALLTAMLNLDGLGVATEIPGRTWAFAALLILSGLAALISMMRTGIRTFWAPLEVIVPRVRVVEAAPIVLLIGLCLALTVEGGAVMRYTDATARSMHQQDRYIGKVLPQADIRGSAAGAAP